MLRCDHRSKGRIHRILGDHTAGMAEIHPKDAIPLYPESLFLFLHGGTAPCDQIPAAIATQAPGEDHAHGSFGITAR